jgi:hypothetical protein
MKIDPVRSLGASQGARRSGEVAPGFAPTASQPAPVAAVSGATPAPGIEAILALQGGAGPDARGRQARRGRRLLDALERLAGALLDGLAPASLKAELESLQAQAQPTGEPGLDALLREIDTRAAVELAKLERLAAPA